MAGIDYDALEGLYRLAGALDELDARAAPIIASHIALEREVMILLERLLRRPEKVEKFSYSSKLDLLHATWVGEDEAAEKVIAALRCFGALRNAVAHGKLEQVEPRLAQLRGAYGRLYPEEGNEASVEDMAGGIIAYFGDGPTPEQLRLIAEGVSQLVKALANVFDTASKSLARD